MNPILYIICYAGLIAVYFALVFIGKVPVDGFIGIITGALAALGATHIATSNASGPAAPAAPPAPTAAATAPAPKDGP